MNAPAGVDGVPGPLDLSGLSSPALLLHPAWLYGVVIDDGGQPGPRRFLASLPQGSAVFALVAPGVSFLLVEQAAAAAFPLTATVPLDAAAIDAWYGALLSSPGFPRSDAQAVPLEAGERYDLAAGTRVTARRIAWLQSKAPILRYCAESGGGSSPATTLLVMADQTSAEVTDDGAVQAIDTATLAARQAPERLGELSAQHAARIAAALIEREASDRRRWRQTRKIDESRAASALQRLRDIAVLRRPSVAPASGPKQDPLASALTIVGASEGFDLRAPTYDDTSAPLFERLEKFGAASGFRFREIALDGDWWKEEGPAFIAIEQATDRPAALVWRGRCWRAVDPATLAETVIDSAAAARLRPSGYLIYASLPDDATDREVWRFAAFGVHGEIRRVLIASATATLAALLIPVATGSILGAAIPDGRLTLLTDMLLLLVAAAIGSGGFLVARAMALIRFGTHLDRRLQAAIWDRVMRLRTSFFRGYSVGDLAQRLLAVDVIRRILTGMSVNAVIGGVFSLASLGVMAIYDGSLAAFAVAYALITGGLLFGVGRAQARLQRQVYNRSGIVSGLLIEIIGGIAKLRIAAAELRAFARWSNAFAEQRSKAASAGRMNALQTVAATSLPFVGSIGIFAVAAGGDHPVDVASFAAFNSAFGQFTAAVLAMATALNSSIDVLPLFARVRPLLRAPLEVRTGRANPGTLDGHLAVRNLWFRYSEDGPWVLQNIDFDVRAGESVALVGVSGSGKSTVLRLLLGLETPTRGGIFYDGKDLGKLDVRLVRRQIGAVLETSGLFPGSLYENIAGSAPLPRERVIEAAHLAGLEDDIAAMPMGLGSFVSEDGSQISGGQRQRLMIARALVNRPRLLYFDEATSALDNRIQANVGRSIEGMNATRIVVAHRLSTIRRVDRILVLDGGRIVESGTFDELIAKAGAFQRLAQRQLL